MTPQTLAIQPGDQIEVDAAPDAIQPRASVTVRVLRANGQVELLQARAAVETQLEVDLLRDGGVIPSILQKTIRVNRERQSVE